jgi:hypothetical protein
MKRSEVSIATRPDGEEDIESVQIWIKGILLELWLPDENQNYALLCGGYPLKITPTAVGTRIYLEHERLS